MDGTTFKGAKDGDGARGFSASDALAEAVRGLPEMWRGAGPVLLAAAACFIASRAIPGLMGSGFLVLAFGFGLAAFGARTRIGMLGLIGARADGLGAGGFQLRKLEARLLGATLLVGLFLTIIISLVVLTALAVFGAAGLNAQAIAEGDWARVGPAWKLAVLSVVGLVLLAVPAVLAIRLCLYAQATLAWGRMASLATSGLTNGAMIGLGAGLLACSAPLMVWWAVQGVFGLSSSATGSLVSASVSALILCLIQAPLTAGFLGHAWKTLGQPPR